MRDPLLHTIQTRRLLADGAMGTQLIEAGLEPGQSGEQWNLSHPDRVLNIHNAYVEAGSELLLTNTFQASPLALARRGLGEKTYEINRQAARLARDSIGSGGYVLGDVGPFGGFLQPLGNTTRRELEDAFRVQVAGLVDGGVDGIIIETMVAMDEIEAGVAATRQCRPHMPIIASVTFDRVADGEFRTMTGVNAADTVSCLIEFNVDVLGCNCGTGLQVADYIDLVREFHQHAATHGGDSKRPIIVQPNAGQPRLDRGRIVYDETPEIMAAAVPALLESGASVIGGCCGTTPQHIRLFGQRMADTQSH